MTLSDLILDLCALRKGVGNVEVVKVASSKTKVIVIIKQSTNQELEAFTLEGGIDGVW